VSVGRSVAKLASWRRWVAWSARLVDAGESSGCGAVDAVGATA